MEDSIIDPARLILLRPMNKVLCKHLDEYTKALKESIVTGGSRENKIRLIEDIRTLNTEIKGRLLGEKMEDK